MTSTAKAGLGLIILALAMPLLLYWGYNTYEKEHLHDQLFSIVKDTSVVSNK